MKFFHILGDTLSANPLKMAIEICLIFVDIFITFQELCYLKTVKIA
jgi:hypothetical protein